MLTDFDLTEQTDVRVRMENPDGTSIVVKLESPVDVAFSWDKGRLEKRPVITVRGIVECTAQDRLDPGARGGA